MSDEPQLPLSGAPTPLPAGPLTFEVNGQRWRVDRFAELATELGVTREDLPRLVALGAQSVGDGVGARGWLVVRRLFGVRPVVPDPGMASDDLRTWGRTELESALGLTRKQLQAELDTVRGRLAAVGDREREAAQAAQAVVAKVKAEKVKAFEASGGELTLATDEATLNRVLTERGFPLDWFDLNDRSAERNQDEKRWLAGRLVELTKLFEHGPTKEIARRLLLCELRLRRRDHVLMLAGDDLDKKGKSARQEWLSALGADEEEFRKLLAQIQDLAPWFFSIGNALNAKGAFGEWVRGMQEFYGEGKTDWLTACARMNDTVVHLGTADGYLTPDELQTLLRPNVEVPEPQYRLSLALFAGVVKQHLWDPAWKPELNHRLLACLDSAFKAAFMEAWKREGLETPNLLKDGPEGEHLPLVGG